MTEENTISGIQYANAVEVRSALPALETHFDAAYVPVYDDCQWEYDPRWGLYDADGVLIEAAAYRRARVLVGQSEHQAVRDLKLEKAPRGRYFYGGCMISHFGHFIISTLARFWAQSKLDLSEYKIICHAAGTPDGWFHHRFVKEIFGALGLTRENFIVFKRPTLIPELVVPRPSVQEHDFVHAIYAELGNAIGAGLVSMHNLPPPGPPVWLAKYALHRGIQGFVNEEELTQVLSRRGVEIVHPQNLLLAQQVMLFATRPTILGVTGSAFHNSILWPAEAKLVCLSPTDAVNSNCALADLANGNRVTYLRAEAEAYTGNHSGAERYDHPMMLRNVERTADLLLEHCSSSRP